jgi:hypothetical protein
VSKSNSQANSNGKGVSHLAILAGEALGQTGTIQDKIAIWAAHQLVKNELWLFFFQHHKKTSVARG